MLNVINREQEEEWASINEVRTVAMEIVKDCIRGASHLGGQAIVGRERRLEVTVFGVKDIAGAEEAELVM